MLQVCCCYADILSAAAAAAAADGDDGDDVIIEATIKHDSHDQGCDNVVKRSLMGFEDELHLDDEEVYQTRWVDIVQARQDAAEHPDLYTQWFRDEMQRMNWLEGGSC